MKKITIPLLLVAALALTGCTGSDSAPDQGTADSKPAAEVAQAPDLTGVWKQDNSASEDAYQQATITAETIAVDWVSDGGETTSIYWVGTFEAPSDAAKPYTWASERDAEATDSALLASSDDTKEFTFDGDAISYKVSALGTTTTVKLKKN